MAKQYQVLFGGTFDPFHCGHLAIAQHVAATLNLEKITLLPANIPPHKTAAKVNSHHRLAMLNALAKTHQLFNVDDRELLREKPSYTVETLQKLKAEQPERNINFIIGMDSLLSFTKWVQWQEILANANLLVCTRPNYNLAQQSKELDAQLSQYISRQITELNHFDLSSPNQVLLLPAINIDISSTEIREFLANKHKSSDPHCKIKRQLPAEILQYLEQHQLYRN
ncbi:nicotinate-nucleotide adenylyltransferase [Colwellia sp. MEBiC06753]